MTNETPEYDVFEALGDTLFEDTLLDDQFHIKYFGRDKCEWGEKKGSIQVCNVEFDIARDLRKELSIVVEEPPIDPDLVVHQMKSEGIGVESGSFVFEPSSAGIASTGNLTPGGTIDNRKKDNIKVMSQYYLESIKEEGRRGALYGHAGSLA